MKEKTRRERTAFGQRLYDARKAVGLTQPQVAAAIPMAQGTLSELEIKGTSSGYTAQLAALYGVDPYVLAEGTESRGGFDLAQALSHLRPYAAPTKAHGRS